MQFVILIFLLTISLLSSAFGDEYHVIAGAAEYIGKEFNIQTPVNKDGLSFLGIPYAEPPTGMKRFNKPVLKEVTGTFNATAYGSSCMQTPGFEILTSSNIVTSEDCLSLNVFLPKDALNGSSKAVMLWIYGGGFIIGDSQSYNPAYLVLLGDVIVVTINYRLGVLGFLSTGDSMGPGNLGLWDQQVAITWVHRNIEYFGGDKNRVAIFGESAGGASVTYQALYSGNNGLLQRAIAESGSTAAVWGSSHMVPNYTKRLAESFGCDVSSSQKTIDCLREISSHELLNTAGNLTTNIGAPPFLPIRDDVFIKYDPQSVFDLTATDDIHPFGDIDYLMGINDYDGLIFTAGLPGYPEMFFKGLEAGYLDHTAIPALISRYFKIDTDLKPIIKSLIAYRYRSVDDKLPMMNLEQLLKLCTDMFFAVPGLKTTKKHAAISGDRKTFVYRFSHPSPYSPFSPTRLKGANHGDEVAYVFGWIMDPKRLNISGEVKDDKDISEAMIKYWTNFAKFGDPNGDGGDSSEGLPAAWPVYNESQAFLEFGATYDDIESSDHMYADRVAFWTELLPSIKLPKLPCTETSSASNVRFSFLVQGFFLSLLLIKKFI